jgi:hypothetical protein
MNDLDMSRPGAELFPEQAPSQYNSYPDVNQGQAVGDPLDMGITQSSEGATQGMSDKEMNFRALGEVVSKLKEEREYWKGQAEAYSKAPARNPEPAQEKGPYEALDFESGQDVRKAFDALRQQNQSLRSEMADAIKAVQTQAKRSDWDSLVTQHVPELTSKNPIFAEMIQKTSNPYEAAYLLAELNARASKPVAAQPPVSENAMRAMHNAQKPQSTNAIGGNGALSAADYYASMSDEDFAKVASRNMANI